MSKGKSRSFFKPIGHTEVRKKTIGMLERGCDMTYLYHVLKFSGYCGQKQGD